MKGTRLSHSFSACQWMRKITPSVIKGMRTLARATAAALKGSSRPDMLVRMSGPSSSSCSTRATMRSAVRMKRKR